MNLLDENIPEDQRRLLQSWGIPVHQVGQDTGRAGMKDGEILPFLHRLRDTILVKGENPLSPLNEYAFFTRDQGFYERSLCHARYCLVYLAVEKHEVAAFVRRILRHPDLGTKAKRMGTILRVSHARICVRRGHDERESRLSW